MRLALFDVDGTLITADGAGMRAFSRAFRVVFGVNVENEIIRPDGKTDPLIAKEFMSYFNIADPGDCETQNRLFSSYLNYLETEMDRAREQGSIRILPGVSELLQTLSSQPDFIIGLATGNLEQGARIKLEKAGLTGYFHFGGYGSDSEDRTTLTKIGIQQGIKKIAPAPFEGACVIGDTPLDIIHGHAADASVIAVASARYSINDLRPYNPDLLISDLRDVESIINFMRNTGSHSF